jgi:hypothetical protein
LHDHRPARREARDLTCRRGVDAVSCRERDDLVDVELEILGRNRGDARGSDRPPERRRQRPPRTERKRTLRGSRRDEPLDQLVRAGDAAERVCVLEREQLSPAVAALFA